MKAHTLRSTLRPLALMATLSCTAPVLADDFIDQWFTQSTYSGPSSFNGQKRNYYSAGTFNARWPTTNDYPITIEPPRLQVGCGGIDMFMGGFSFLDEDYLVEKAERIIQAAPAFAFQLALQSLSQQVKTEMSDLTDRIDQLNSIQLNDCRQAKRLVMAVAEDKNVLGEMYAEATSGLSVGSGDARNSQEYADKVDANNGYSTEDTRELLEGCPAAFKEIFTSGSVISNISDQYDLGDGLEYIRGLIGDVSVTFNPTANTYIATPIEPCSQNDALSADDIIEGTIYTRTESGSCEQTTSKSIIDEVSERLGSVADAINNARALSTTDQEFLDRTPLPVYSALRDASAAGTSDAVVELLTEPVAAMTAYRILDDLYKHGTAILRMAATIANTQTNTTSGSLECNPIMLRSAVTGVNELNQRAQTWRMAAQANYSRSRDELIANQHIATEMLNQRRRNLNTTISQTN